MIINLLEPIWIWNSYYLIFEIEKSIREQNDYFFSLFPLDTIKKFLIFLEKETIYLIYLIR